MIVVRITFHCKFGKAGEALALMKSSLPTLARQGLRSRLYTDLSGRFDTITLETEAESMAVSEQQQAAMFASPEYQSNAQRMAELVEWGSKDFYTIEAQI